MDNSNFASCSKLRFVLFRCFSRIILSHASNNNPIPKKTKRRSGTGVSENRSQYPAGIFLFTFFIF